MTYAELVQRPVADIRCFLAAHPGHIGAVNALAEVERMDRAKKVLARIAAASATVSGNTKTRYPARGSRRCPTKRELR